MSDDSDNADDTIDFTDRSLSVKSIGRELRRRKLLHPEQVAEDRAALELYEADRPRTRGDCLEGGINAQRPCPWVSCRWHLYLDVLESGSIHFNHPGKEVEELQETCALDVADRDGAILEEIGGLLNVTRERVRQMENKASRLIGLRVDRALLSEDQGPRAPRAHDPESHIGKALAWVLKAPQRWTIQEMTQALGEPRPVIRSSLRVLMQERFVAISPGGPAHIRSYTWTGQAPLPWRDQARTVKAVLPQEPELERDVCLREGCGGKPVQGSDYCDEPPCLEMRAKAWAALRSARTPVRREIPAVPSATETWLTRQPKEAPMQTEHAHEEPPAEVDDLAETIEGLKTLTVAELDAYHSQVQRLLEAIEAEGRRRYELASRRAS